MNNTNLTIDNIFMNCINTAASALTMSQDKKSEILQKYEMLASTKFDCNNTLLLNNLDNYGILLNKTLFLAIVQSAKPIELMNYTNLNKLLQDSINKREGKKDTATFKLLHTTLSSLVKDNGGTIANAATPEHIAGALETFGIDTADEEDIQENIGEEIDIDIDDIFDENNEPELEDKDLSEADESIFDISDDNKEIEEDIENIDLEDIENELELPEEDNDETSEDSNDSNEDYLDAFREIYEGDDFGNKTALRTAIDGVMKSIEELYASCFSGITKPDGILTDKGILSLDKIGTQYKYVYNHSDVKSDTKDWKNKEYIKYAQNKSKYGQYYKAIMYALGIAFGAKTELHRGMSIEERNASINNAVSVAESKFGRQADGRKSVEPKYEDAVNMIQYYPRLHTEFMTGNYHASSEMQKWAEESKAKRNAVKITNFDDIMAWARKRVSNCLTQALIDNGMTIEDSGDDARINSICQIMTKNIKNIIVITNMKKSFLTLKICTGEPFDVNKFVSNVEKYFNSASDGSKAAELALKNNGENAGVIEVDIILDRADYDKSSSFSADVIDNIIETGSVPSWSNAILGEKNNGGTMTFNFKKSCSVAIYGASGSGKGIMTSALLSNAIAEGCEIFYFDGKPDNGAALAKIAWDASSGDVAVFNGLQGGSDTFPGHLEEYSHGIRDVSLRSMNESMIPIINNTEVEWPFNDEKARKQLLEVSLTLNAFQFVHDMILLRTDPSNLEKSSNGKTRWAVFVIDEIQDAAVTEKLVRNLMQEYMDVVGETQIYKTEEKVDGKGNKTVQQKTDGKIKDPKNWSKDTGYLFCKKWIAWAESRCTMWENVVTKSLRNSSSTLITIFQSNGWLTQDGKGAGKTKIGKLMLKVSQKTTKIVGKGALVSANQWGDASSYNWESETGKGKWAIAKGEDGLTDDAHIFKPFKVFTTDLGDKVTVPFDDFGAGATDCWQNIDNKTGKKPLGLQSYMKYLFAGLESEIANEVDRGDRLPETASLCGVLTSSLDYFNKIITNNHDNKGIMHYMYNVKCIEEFSGNISEEEALSIQSETEKLEDSELDSLNSSLSNVEINNDDEILNYGTNEEEAEAVSENQVSENQSISEFERNLLNRHTQSNEVPKFSTTIALMNKNLSDEALLNYMRKYRLTGRLQVNKFNYSDRNKGSNNGLQMACYTIGNYYYVCNIRHLDDIESIKQFAYNQISANAENSNQFKLLLGMIDAYDTSELQFDVMPSQELMREWLNKYTEVTSNQNQDTINNTYESIGNDVASILSQSYTENDISFETDEYQNNSNISTQYYEECARADVEMPLQNPCYTTDNKGNIQINPRQTQNVFKVTPENSHSAELGLFSFLDKRKKTMFESKYGIAYEYKKRWEQLLDSIINRFGQASMINQVGILNGVVQAKNLEVNPRNFVDDELGITLYDLIEWHTLFKKFPMLELLLLDANATQKLVNHYGDTAQNIWSMFQEARNLRVLVTYDSNGNRHEYKRNEFAETANELNKELSEIRAKSELQHVCDTKNPRIKEKGKGYAFNVAKNAKEMSKHSWGTAKQAFMEEKPKLIKSILYTGICIPIIGVGLAAGAISGIQQLFSNN